MRRCNAEKRGDERHNGYYDDENGRECPRALEFVFLRLESVLEHCARIVRGALEVEPWLDLGSCLLGEGLARSALVYRRAEISVGIGFAVFILLLFNRHFFNFGLWLFDRNLFLAGISLFKVVLYRFELVCGDNRVVYRAVIAALFNASRFLSRFCFGFCSCFSCCLCFGCFTRSFRRL